MPSGKSLKSLLKTIFAPLASLKLTVVLLAMSVFLVFAGTVAQVDNAIHAVVEENFRTWYTTFELQSFFPKTFGIPEAARIPFAGGKTIGVLLLANLLAAHLVRFRVKGKGVRLAAGVVVLAAAAVFTGVIVKGVFVPEIAMTEGDATLRVLYRLLKGFAAAVALLTGCILVFGKRAGIVLVHGGIIFLLAAEFYTADMMVETQMRIPEGESRDWVYDNKKPVIAVVDPTPADTDRVISIPKDHIRVGETISHEALPFDIQVLRYMDNSGLVDVGNLGENKPNPATRGAGLFAYAEPRPGVTGTMAQRVDMPSAYVRLVSKDGREDLGTYMLTTLSVVYSLPPEVVTVDGIPYEVSLRFRRTYKPYTIELRDFNFDRYVGTETPKDFSSHIVLRDPARNVERNVRIWMNNPLRYRGETFYQQSFEGPTENITVLQVVRNGSWLIPYVSCMLALVGLTAHFGVHLQGFVRRRFFDA